MCFLPGLPAPHVQSNAASAQQTCSFRFPVCSASCSIGIVSYHATRFIGVFFFYHTHAAPAAADQAISPWNSPCSMLPRSLRSAARRLPAAATRAAASVSVARSPEPVPARARQVSPPPEDVDGRAPQQHAAEWDDDDDLSPDPDAQWLCHRRMPRRDFSCITYASRDHSGLTQQLLDFQHATVDETDEDHDPFRKLKARFMDFKQQNYLENFTKYQNLAEQQTPEFMVIACADSRVCPSSILGFQPGDAFTVRNIANLVPPYQHGASETTAGLEFAVNSLKVPNVLVVGHSRCGGIQALMSMKSKKDGSNSRSFIKDWVSLGKSARLSTEAAAGNLNFEMQCRHCEKESINNSLLNLLTYPWIEERVNEGTLNLHGGYYNFVDCTFEKWTLVYRQGLEGGSKYAIKNRSTWS